MSKDLFSGDSDQYRYFRPAYPRDLIAFLAGLCQRRERAWDCACGNGQAAGLMSDYFLSVEATDISASQIAEAVQRANINYSIRSAEDSKFPMGYFDLCVVAQAVHWFDFDRFFGELNRVMKPGGIVALIGYGLMETGHSMVNQLIHQLYKEVLGPYWDPEREHIDSHYQKIPFPYISLTAPHFEMNVNWTRDHLLGYLSTWSAVKHYKKQKNEDPLLLFSEQLFHHWQDLEVKEVSFPLILKIGQLV